MTFHVQYRVWLMATYLGLDCFSVFIFLISKLVDLAYC